MIVRSVTLSVVLSVSRSVCEQGNSITNVRINGRRPNMVGIDKG